jgi:16S rRNA processing protein RimM
MVCLGLITAAHGVRGAVRIRSFTMRPEDLVAYGDLFDERGERCFRLHLIGVARGGLVANIDGIDERSAAERLLGQTLHVPRAALPATDPEEYYHADLVGLRAELVEGGDEALPLGKVVGIDDFGAGPVLEIALAGAPPLMVPFTRAMVPWIDLDAGRIGVVAVAGLLNGASSEETSPPAPADL